MYVCMYIYYIHIVCMYVYVHNRFIINQHLMKNYIQSKFIGYEPNKNAAISTVWVWEPLGCCTGTLSPTPNPAGLWEDVGGCFCEYDETITYVAGDKISKRKYGSQVIYQCKGAPMDQFCSMTVSKCYISPLIVLQKSSRS